MASQSYGKNIMPVMGQVKEEKMLVVTSLDPNFYYYVFCF
jgi:hypothetical protein